MIMSWNRREKKLVCGNRKIPCSCIVRNELNGWRPLANKPAQDEVVRSLPENIPYMPRPFPVGRWNVGRPVPRSHPYKAPYYIPTDAFQMLPRWELDDDGGYLRETEDMVRDEDYGLHCSSSNTTLGCIRITKEKDLLWMVEKINRTLDTGEKVYLEVAA